MVKLLGVGSDISKARSRLGPNFEILDYPETEDKINQYIKETIEKEYEGKPLLSTILEQLALSLFYVYVKESIVNISKRISRRPFRIACVDVYVIEVLYLLSNDSDKDPEPFLEKLFLRKMVPIISVVSNNSDIQSQSVLSSSEFLRKTFTEEQQDAPDFPFLFAYTIRQTSINDLDAFLSYRKRLYKGDFHKFLELALLDYSDDIILPKQKKFCEDWLTSQSSIEKARNYLPELRVPKGWVIIPGRLKGEALIRFFSFFYLETNGGPNGATLLTREETTQLLKHGFAYPPEEQAVSNMFTLQISRKLPKGLVYYMFYHLYEKHSQADAKIDYKKHFALFLKRRFTNFKDLDVETINKSIRDRKPKTLWRGFELEVYLG